MLFAAKFISLILFTFIWACSDNNKWLIAVSICFLLVILHITFPPVF